MSRQPTPEGRPGAQTEDEPNLFLVVEPFTFGSYSAAVISLALIVAFLAVLVRIVFASEASFDHALLIVVAMIFALLLGWVLASLFSPLSSTEETQFRRILGTLGGVISGFTLAKVSDLIKYLSDKFTGAPDNWVEIGFFVLTPLSCLLAGIISATIFRAVIVSYWENRRQLQRRLLYERKLDQHF